MIPPPPAPNSMSPVGRGVPHRATLQLAPCGSGRGSVTMRTDQSLTHLATIETGSVTAWRQIGAAVPVVAFGGWCRLSPLPLLTFCGSFISVGSDGTMA